MRSEASSGQSTLVVGCGVPRPQKWWAGNRGVTSVGMSSPQSVSRGPWIKSWELKHRQRKKSLRRNEDKVGNQKFGRRHQESFKGGRGYLCQMLLAKKLSETCLGSMSPRGCQWSQQGQLPSMGAEFLPTAVHSTDWVLSWQASSRCIPISAEVSPLTCLTQPGPHNLYRIIHRDSRLTGHLEDDHQVWKQRWHNFIVLNATFLFCCVPDFMATPCDDQERTALPEWVGSTWVASDPHRASWVIPLRGWQRHNSSCVGSKFWSPSSEQPVGDSHEPLLRFNNVQEWLTECRKTLYWYLWGYYKGYNSEMARQKRFTGQGIRGAGLSCRPSPSVPPTQV